jgi:hypothetical protein
MLRSNLSTRPFYNDRLVSLGILLAVVVTLALMAFNVTQIMALSGERGVYTEQIDRNHAEAARIRGAAAGLQKSIDQAQLKVLFASTREANRLIDQRTFSWTAFFESVEKTLPLDARLVAVEPRVERGQFQIVMVVIAKAVDDLEAFTDALHNTGMFYDIGPRAQQVNEDGTLSARIEGGYLPPSALAPPEEAAAPIRSRNRDAVRPESAVPERAARRDGPGKERP